MGYKVWFKTKVRRPLEVDLDTDRREDVDFDGEARGPGSGSGSGSRSGYVHDDHGDGKDYYNNNGKNDEENRHVTVASYRAQQTKKSSVWRRIGENF